MRTAYRALSTAVAVGAMFPIGMPTASAATSRDVVVETAAWFWSTQTSAAPGGASVPRSLSGVPENDLAVAYKGDTKADADGNKTSVPDKETYLAWDFSDIPQESSVESFVFTMFLDPKANQFAAPPVPVPGQGTKLGQPSIVACLAKQGFGEADGESFAVKPEDDCADQVFGEFEEKTKSYTFHATPYAQDWVDGKDNFGVGIRPLEDATEPFQLHFLPGATVKATIVYTPPEPDDRVEVPPPFVEPIPLPPAPPTDVEVFVPAPAAPQPQVQPQVQPKPEVAPPVVVQTRAAAPIQNVAARPISGSGALTPLFWFAMLGGVLLLGITSLVLGDPLEPAGLTSTGVRTGGRHLAPAGVAGRSTRPIRPRTV